MRNSCDGRPEASFAERVGPAEAQVDQDSGFSGKSLMSEYPPAGVRTRPSAESWNGARLKEKELSRRNLAGLRDGLMSFATAHRESP